jgi:hypothetical protein
VGRELDVVDSNVTPVAVTTISNKLDFSTVPSVRTQISLNGCPKISVIAALTPDTLPTSSIIDHNLELVYVGSVHVVIELERSSGRNRNRFRLEHRDISRLSG